MVESEQILQLREDVSKNKGDVVLCWREFSFSGERTGDCIPPTSQRPSHYSAGIVVGDLEPKQKWCKINRKRLTRTE